MHTSFQFKWHRIPVLALLTLACFWLISCSARADSPSPTELDEIGSGTLLFRTDTPGQFLPAPLLASDVQLSVSGPVIRAKLTQKFTNTSDQWVEGLYVFPLPDEAAVDRLIMIIGDRVIEGQIQEKRKAREIYETAKAAGKKASLIEQSRPNIFTNSVANIGPGETIIIQIEYQDKAAMKDGVFSLHFPMTVAPRFSPKGTNALGGKVSEPAPQIPVTLNVELDAGFELQSISSPSHRISVTGTKTKTIALDGPIAADRDFVLNWSPATSKAPLSAVFTEQIDGETYVLAMVQTPAGMGENTVLLPREVIYVIDNSGSMAGKSIRQARAALLQGLAGLRPTDLFNVIQFDNQTDLLFTQSVPANPVNLAKAQAFVSALEGDGGTVMLPALQASLRTSNSQKTRVRQVVFVTDGQIDNEDELFTEISDHLGASRLFVIGIGSAPNRYFASRAARLGRGTDLVINDLDQVQEKMAALLKKLERPVMQDLLAHFARQGDAPISPNPLPDLYADEPVVILARLRDVQDHLLISGRRGAGSWSADLDLATARKGHGLHVLWARAQIRDLEESRFTGRNMDEINQSILALAVQHHLVSRLTSLVAVDVTPTRAATDRLDTRTLPLQLPDGWGALEASIGFTPASPAPAVMNRSRGIALPATASPYAVQLILGLLLIAFALVLFGRMRPRRVRS